MIDKIKNMIKMAVIRAVKEEYHQEATANALGVEHKSVMYSPYGLYSRAKKGCLAILFQIGDRGSTLSLAWDSKNRKKLNEGEVALWNIEKNIGVHLKDTGEVEIQGTGCFIRLLPTGDIAVDGDFVASGGIEAGGDISAEGNITAMGDIQAGTVSLLSHVHQAGALLDSTSNPVTGSTSTPT